MPLDFLGAVAVQPLRSRVPTQDRAGEGLGDDGVFRCDDEGDVVGERVLDVLALGDVLRRADHPDRSPLPITHDHAAAAHDSYGSVRAPHDAVFTFVWQAFLQRALDGLPQTRPILGMSQLERSSEAGFELLGYAENAIQLGGPGHGVVPDVPFPAADLRQAFYFREVREPAADIIAKRDGLLLARGGARAFPARLTRGVGLCVRGIGFFPRRANPGSMASNYNSFSWTAFLNLHEDDSASLRSVTCQREPRRTATAHASDPSL